MPEPPPDHAPEAEVARNFTDQEMVFRSPEAPSPKHMNKDMKLKATKAKFKPRRCTPAPPSKANGRKCFVLSPLPEDKQLRKKNSFSGEGSPNVGSPKCKTSIFQVSSTNDEEKMRHVGQDGVVHAAPAPDSDQMAGGLMNHVTQDEDKTPHPLVANKTSPCDDVQVALVEDKVQTTQIEKGTKESLACAMVPHQLRSPHGCMNVGEALHPSKGHMALEIVGDNLPKMGVTTKGLLEINLAPTPPGPSSVLEIVKPQMETKMNPILQLVALDTAERLDMAAAQPLITKKQPEVEHSRVTQFPQLPWSSEPATDYHANQNASSLEEFPPLGRSRTRKTRESSENGPNPPHFNTNKERGHQPQPTMADILRNKPLSNLA